MSIYFFLNSRDVFRSFAMGIDVSPELVSEYRNEFKKLSRKKDNVYYTAGEFQKYLTDMNIDNKFLYEAKEIVWK